MNILIVEDARDQRMMLSVILKKKGHQVLEAENGKEALEVLNGHPEVRIVISDWMMPEMDGIQLCQEIRESDLGRYIYFLLLTGKTDHEAVVQGMELGADDFLTKPVNFDELDARLKAGIRIVELEQALEQKIRIIEKDLESAATTQEALLSKPTRIQSVEFNRFFKPSRILGGDMFGYQAMDDENISFYQLDVAGHGIPSALFSFSLNNILSATGSRGSLIKESLKEAPFYRIRYPDDVLVSLNNRFQASPEAMLYFTIAYGLINSRTGSVTLSQAGHPYPLWLKSNKQQVTPVQGGGVPIGMMPGMSYQNHTIKLQPGDRLFLYSDGVTECENPEGEHFGEERLICELKQGFNEELQQLTDRIESAITQWNGTGSFEDDVTYLLLEWNP